MNKKFSTLMALAFAVVGTVSAQVNWYETGTYQANYRTFQTESAAELTSNKALQASLDVAANPGVVTGALTTGGDFSKFINYIDATKWYQLELAVDGAPIEYGGTKAVLVQERDYKTGKVYLRALLKNSATTAAKLNASLWQIKYSKPDGVSGGYFTYVNKETGLELTFDHSVINNDEVSELRDEVKDWSWYTINKSVNNFDFQTVYSYLHNQAADQVMYLTKASGATNYTEVANELKDNGFRLSATAGWLIQAKVANTVDAGASLEAVADEAIQLRPVVAMPFFMNAQEFNTRMDADDKANGKSFKFNLSKTLIGQDPLVAPTFKAENVTAGAGYEGYTLRFNNGSDEYLMVAMERYQEDIQPSLSPAVKLAIAEYDNTSEFIEARYIWRATYYPTNDSLVLEPKNAAVQTDAEWSAGTAWTASQCCTSYFVNDYTKANTVVNDFNYNGSQTVALTSTEINGLGEVLTVGKDNLNEFRIKTSIDRPFSYLKRATVKNGLYYLNLVNGNERQRDAGMSIVHNMGTKMMYDTEAVNQDYSLMPATMWVVEQEGCESAPDAAKYVKIANREYRGQVFYGQLYVNENGEYFFIDRSDIYMQDYETTGWFENTLGNALRQEDVLKITEVTAQDAYTKHHGYKWLPTDLLEDGVENNFQINWNNAYNDKLILKHVSGQNIKVAEDDATIYEIAEATLTAGGIYNMGAIVNTFGTALNGEQLERKAYLIKVKDHNLIDNDRLFLASVKDADGRYYYKAMKLDEMDNYSKKLAILYLKADQIHMDAAGAVTDTCYVMVDVNAPSATALDLRIDNGWMKAAVEAGSTMSMIRDNNLEDQPNDVSDAFYFNGRQVAQYIDLAADYNVDLNGNIKIFNKLAQKNYLFEDKKDANNVSAIQDIIPGYSYLGVESKGLDVEDHAALYVDEVVLDNPNMQRYLLGIRVDSVADGLICLTKTHGYWETAAEAEAADETHYNAYNGYTAGWFLVNLEDYIGLSTNMLYGADVYKFNSYTRLAFVQAIHMLEGEDAEALYILNDGVNLADLMTIVDNTNGGKVLDPDLLASKTVRVEISGDTNTTQTWSLRKTQDNIGTAEESEPFLLESECEFIGAFVGSWVKVHNGVPVIAQNWTDVENHEGEADLVGELVGQSGIFYFETTEDAATANESIAAEGVSVVAGEGVITIAGAAGKKVVITNILGQTVANTVVASDNATVAAPAGVVVVSVEGEAAVKAVVK